MQPDDHRTRPTNHKQDRSQMKRFLVFTIACCDRVEKDGRNVLSNGSSQALSIKTPFVVEGTCSVFECSSSWVAFEVDCDLNSRASSSNTTYEKCNLCGHHRDWNFSVQQLISTPEALKMYLCSS